MLYFAYGSNLHHFQMKRRCKDSTFIKKINLKDFRLTFRSKYRAADIEPSRGLGDVYKRQGYSKFSCMEKRIASNFNIFILILNFR